MRGNSSKLPTKKAKAIAALLNEKTIHKAAESVGVSWAEGIEPSNPKGFQMREISVKYSGN